MDPATIAALMNAAATAARTLSGIIEAIEVGRGAKLTDEEIDTIHEGKAIAEAEWAALAPGRD